MNKTLIEIYIPFYGIKYYFINSKQLLFKILNKSYAFDNMTELQNIVKRYKAISGDIRL